MPSNRDPKHNASGAPGNSYGGDPTKLRLLLLRNGYPPVPIYGPTVKVKSAGKRPPMDEWQIVCDTAGEKEIIRWIPDYPTSTNTGIKCGRTVGGDIDVRDPELARQLTALARTMLGDTPLERVGMAPKTLLAYRADVTFGKIMTPRLILPDGSDAQIEILAEGQQFVAYGIHPDTLAPYEWLHGGPDTIPWEDLPVVTEEACRAFVAAAEAILRAAGGRTKAEIEGKVEKKAGASKGGAKVIDFEKAASDNAFFREVNRQALGAIEKWFPQIFPAAEFHSRTGAWRVSSQELGRQYEEDLSMHPTEGGRDFGPEQSVSPIDVVMDHGGAADAKQAAGWLCGQMQVDPTTLGWRDAASNSRDQRAGTSSSDKQSKASERKAEEWPDPGSLAPPVPPAPPFPVAALPHAIKAFVNDEADRMQAPVDLLAIPVLIMLAGCIGKDPVIRPKQHDDWAERACLWGMVIQPPGSMKSAAVAKATAPLRRIEGELREEDERKLAEWSELKDEADLRLKAWEKDCAQLMKNSEECYDAALPAKPRVADDLPTRPPKRRLITQEVTAEKLGEMMVESRGLTLVRDELSGWVLNMSRYNGGSDRQFYLEAYSGGSYAVDRIRRGETHIPDVYINIVGGIQPSVAKKLFSIRDGSDDGFFDRFGLIAFPDLPDDWKLVDRWPETGLRQAVNAVADKLASTDWAVTLHTDADVEAGKAKPYARFSPAAQEIFNAWLVEHMGGLKAAADTPIGGFYSKARGLLGRLTLVIHLTAWAAGDEADPRVVSEQSLGRALAILEKYLAPMWHRVTAAFSKAPVVDGANRIAAYIRKKELTGIRVADITKLEWPEFPDRETVEAAFRALVDRDWLAEPEPVPGARGRPSAAYIVNPKVHQMFGAGNGDDHG
jgi:hypothetical protein